VREHLHRFGIGEKIFQMIVDERANPLLSIFNFFQALAQALDDSGKGVPLDQVEQLFF
jgi:hypothetical protein